MIIVYFCPIYIAYNLKYLQIQFNTYARAHKHKVRYTYIYIYVINIIDLKYVVFNLFKVVFKQTIEMMYAYQERKKK